MYDVKHFLHFYTGSNLISALRAPYVPKHAREQRLESPPPPPPPAAVLAIAPLLPELPRLSAGRRRLVMHAGKTRELAASELRIQGFQNRGALEHVSRQLLRVVLEGVCVCVCRSGELSCNLLAAC